MVKFIFVKDICGYGGMADASDSKSDGGDFVWVQVPLSASIFFCTFLVYTFQNMHSILHSESEEIMANPLVTFELESGDIIKAELYPEIAPNTVNNFIYLINKGFYDGLIFHRVIAGFMIQGGCPDGNGTGGPGYSIKGEFAANGFENNLLHSAGVLSMARAYNPNSAGSQFFIMHEDAPHLDGQYAAFGKVVEGMDVVDIIATTKTDYSDRPLFDVVIKKVTVDTMGNEYPAPDKY